MTKLTRMDRMDRMDRIKGWVMCLPLYRLPEPLWKLVGSPLLAWAMEMPLREWWKGPWNRKA